MNIVFCKDGNEQDLRAPLQKHVFWRSRGFTKTCKMGLWEISCLGRGNAESRRWMSKLVAKVAEGGPSRGQEGPRWAQQGSETYEPRIYPMVALRFGDHFWAILELTFGACSWVSQLLAWNWGVRRI